MMTKSTIYGNLPHLQPALRRIRVAALVLALAAAALVFVPSTAMAEDDFHYLCPSSGYSCQNGVRVSGTGAADTCGWAERQAHYTLVCIKYYGDYVYVYDGQADGHSAIGAVRVSGGQTKFCRNKLGAGTTTRCNFDWRESPTKHVDACYRYSYRSIYCGNDYQWSFSGK